MSNSDKYWFPAKAYGWGWGFPNNWQGWFVLTAYVGGIAAAGVFLPAGARPLKFSAVVGVLSVVLLIVCWLKGEPPRWRWGRK